MGVDNLSPQEVMRIDRRRVFELYDGWPADAEDALGTQVQVPKKKYERVAYLAVGGSATGGDIISDWLLSSGGVEVSVYRGDLPRINLDGTLVIVCSTSGDTEETLQMASQMASRHPDMVAISSGGRLKQLAEKEGIVHVKIKLTQSPRFTLPYSLFASVAVLRSASLLDGMEWELGETVSTLKETSQAIGMAVPTHENVAKQLAEAVSNKEPYIYATSASKSVARRFKNSLNENAKMMATFASAPDFLHNEIEMWEVPDPKRKPVLLQRTDDPAFETKSLEAFSSILEARGVIPHRVFATGNGNLAQLMKLCYTLDFASYYAAILRGVEPFGIGLIDELKRIR